MVTKKREFVVGNLYFITVTGDKTITDNIRTLSMLSVNTLVGKPDFITP